MFKSSSEGTLTVSSEDQKIFGFVFVLDMVKGAWLGQPLPPLPIMSSPKVWKKYYSETLQSKVKTAKLNWALKG